MAAGAVMGAFSGNLANVVVGAVTGCFMSVLGPLGLIAQAGMLGYSIARNGPNALAVSLAH